MVCLSFFGGGGLLGDGGETKLELESKLKSKLKTELKFAEAKMLFDILPKTKKTERKRKRTDEI